MYRTKPNRETSISYRLLFHRRTRTAYLYNGCLAWYKVVLTVLTGPFEREIVVPEGAINKIHRYGLVRRWNKCVKPLPVVVKFVTGNGGGLAQLVATLVLLTKLLYAGPG